MTVLASAKLVNDADELVLLPSDTVLLTAFEVGTPEVRAVMRGRAGRDGYADETAHLGNGLATISGEFWGDETSTAAELLDRLKRFCHPSRRPLLVYRWDGTEERTATLRYDGIGDPVTVERQNLIAWHVSWHIPAGVSVGVRRTVTANPGLGESGRTYPKTYPRAYPLHTGNGTVLVEHPGSAPTAPLVRVYGPCSGPRLANNTTGQRLEFFSSLSVAAGDFLELDFDQRTVRMNGNADAGANRRRYLDFGRSAWWTLQPGMNEVVYYPITSTVPSVAEITYAPAYV